VVMKGSHWNSSETYLSLAVFFSNGGITYILSDIV
jgi:hypothetical protein